MEAAPEAEPNEEDLLSLLAANRAAGAEQDPFRKVRDNFQLFLGPVLAFLLLAPGIVLLYLFDFGFAVVDDIRDFRGLAKSRMFEKLRTYFVFRWEIADNIGLTAAILSLWTYLRAIAYIVRLLATRLYEPCAQLYRNIRDRITPTLLAIVGPIRPQLDFPLFAMNDLLGLWRDRGRQQGQQACQAVSVIACVDGSNESVEVDEPLTTSRGTEIEENSPIA